MATTGSFTHALFDVDGTLVQSIEQVEEAWQIWCTEYGLSPKIFGHGQTAVSALKGVLPADEMPAALHRLSKIEIELAVSVRARPGALDLLRSLPSGWWGVVTSAARSVAHARLTAAGIEIPRVFVTGDDVSEGKPSPEGFQLARTLLNRPGPCVAFEDTSVGATAARAAQCFTVGVVGLESVTTLAEACHTVVRDLTEVRLTASDVGGGFTLGGSGPIEQSAFDL